MRLLHLLAIFLLSTSLAFAHGPTRQKVTEKVTINAPVAKVWGLVKDFDALSKWHPAVADSPADKGNTVGSVRNLKLKDGGALVETLEDYSAEKMTIKYRAKDGGALPVTNYTSTLMVKGEGNGTEVTWRGAFYRAYPNNDPPPGQDDEAAVAAVTGVYQSGLANLKKLAEQ